MAWHLITSLLSLCSNLLPSIRASAEAPSSSDNNTSEKERKAIEEDLEALARTLKRINATLQDSEERDIESSSVKLWLKELKEVAHDAEDLLGECQYEVKRVKEEARKASEASGGSSKRKQMECIVPIPNDMGERLKKIRSKFDEIAKDREALQLKEGDGAKHPNNRIVQPPTGHMVDEASIFRRAVEVTKVINFLLLEREKPLSVISIIGKGGLGKTTIAQLIYKDKRVCNAFDSFGWVCVYEEFDVKRLIKATIESVYNSYCGLSELSPLQEKLRKTIKGKKLLLVLDDVWNENESLWELFFIPFKEAKLMRFLVTTRNKNVTEVMQTTVCFQPKYLSENSCWQLFQRYAFGSTSNSHLVEMGREIMKKCGGLPLAVKSIAILRYKVDEESWREILESDLWESNSLNDIFPALQIGYIHLPAHLKPCFLICSMYPKDYELKKMNLIELWISHGYIKSSSKKDVRQIGIEYYEELIGRSFLDQVSSSFLYGFSKLHDIIHDLAKLNSGGEHCSINVNHLPNIQQVNILQETCHLYIGGFTGYVNQILQQNLKGLRSLSMDIRICNDDSEHQYCLKSIEAIDSNIELSEYYEDCMRNTIIYNFNKFPALRVLELSGDCLTEIPDSVTQLKHLSFLHICSNHLENLPSSMNLLCNLQSLILDCRESPLEHLSESIGNLVNLRALYINIAYLPEFPESLCCLNNLEDLYISTMGGPSELPRAFGNCCKLKTLKATKFYYYNPRGLKNFPVIRTMNIFLEVGTIGRLKYMKDLEGGIIIMGLENMNNLVDAQHASIRSKGKIKFLKLSWDCHNFDVHVYGNTLTIRVQEEQPHEDRFAGEDMGCDLLECLQPHP